MSIRTEHLTHIYQKGTAMESCALNDVTVEIPDGSFTGIIGHTGSGKSTFVQHLNGLLKPDSGTVFFDDEDVFAAGYNLKNLRSRVGLVFQYPEYQLFEETVIKDVMFGPLNMGMGAGEAEEAAGNALETLGISEELYQHSPFELSGGQKRNVAIAGVLAMNPRVLILDEPTAGLDPLGRIRILSLLSDLNRTKNITVVLVSHSMEDVASYADFVLVFHEGCLKYSAPPKEIFSHGKELAQMGLAVPAMTLLAQKLSAAGFDIDESIGTVEEAREEILRIFRERKAACHAN